MKTRKSVARRFKITKTGKVIRHGSHVSHLRRKKKKSQIRRQKLPKQVKGKRRIKIKKILGK